MSSSPFASEDKVSVAVPPDKGAVPREVAPLEKETDSPSGTMPELAATVAVMLSACPM